MPSGSTRADLRRRHALNARGPPPGRGRTQRAHPEGRARRGRAIVRLAPTCRRAAGIVTAMAPRPELRFDSARDAGGARPHLAAPGAAAGAARGRRRHGHGGTGRLCSLACAAHSTQLRDAPCAEVPLAPQRTSPSARRRTPPGVQGPPRRRRLRRRAAVQPLATRGARPRGGGWRWSPLQGAGVIDFRLLVEADDPPPALSRRPSRPWSRRTPGHRGGSPTPGTTVPLSPPLRTSPGTAAPQAAPRPASSRRPAGRHHHRRLRRRRRPRP